MRQIGNWNGFTFEVSPTVVRGFSGLTIRGGCEAEEKVSEKYKYIERLNSTPTEVSLDVYLNAYLGCNVRDEAFAFVHAATEGAKNYFYVGGKKLLPTQLMLIQADIAEIMLNPMGEWISCRISLTLKQCEKYPKGSTGGSSGGGGGSSSGGGKPPQKETVTQPSWTRTAADAVRDGVAAVVQGAQSLVATLTAAVAGVPDSAKTQKDETTRKAESTVSQKTDAARRAAADAGRATRAAQTAAARQGPGKTTVGGNSKVTATAKR